MFFGQCLSCVAFFLMGTGSEALCMYTYVSMGWLRLVGLIQLQVTFAEYRLVYRALLQKRPINLSILLAKATPYVYVCISRICTWPYLCIYISLYIYIYMCIYLYVFLYIIYKYHGSRGRMPRWKIQTDTCLCAHVRVQCWFHAYVNVYIQIHI